MIWTKTLKTLFHDKGQTQCQRLFLKGGRWHIIPQLAVYTLIYCLLGGPICYLPSFTGTRNNHWQWRSPARSVPASISIAWNSQKTQTARCNTIQFLHGQCDVSRACLLMKKFQCFTYPTVHICKEFLCICVLTCSCLFYQFPTSICMIPHQSFQP